MKTKTKKKKKEKRSSSFNRNSKATLILGREKYYRCIIGRRIKNKREKEREEERKKEWNAEETEEGRGGERNLQKGN